MIWFCLLLPLSVAFKPHVLLIVIDDLGWNDVSFRGAEFTTPTIDELAYSGIRLDNYYVQPTCSPTRAALMSARYPYNMGLAHTVIHNGIAMNLPLSASTIANIMHQGGYQTHMSGKWDLGFTTWDMTPTYRGFDSFLGFYGAVEDHFWHFVDAGLDLPQNMSCGGVDFRNNTEPYYPDDLYSTFAFTDEMLRQIRSYRPGDHPLFLYLAYQAVHAPLQVPSFYVESTDCANITERPRQVLCGMMKCVDQGIHNITALLKEMNLFSDTLIIFTTDNGGQTQAGSSNWPLRGNKETVWEGGVKGNAFVSGYGIPSAFANSSNSGLFHVTDWLPTLAEIANVSITQLEIDGVSQYSTLFQNESSSRQEILLQLDPVANYFGEHFIGQAAIRYNNWKLIIGQPNCTFPTNWTHPYVPFQDPCPSGWVRLNGSEVPPPPNDRLVWLFDISSDPLEQFDVSLQNPSIVEFLQTRIESYNSTHVRQLNPPLNLFSCPEFFDPPAWTPWG